MSYWIKKDNRKKSQIFICPLCKKECNCIAYIGNTKFTRINICDYKFCPYCGKKIESEEVNESTNI